MGPSLLFLIAMASSPHGAEKAAEPPATAPRVTGCRADDVDCLRQEYDRLRREEAKRACAKSKDCEDMEETSAAPAKTGLPFWAVFPAQWLTTVVLECLPAGILVAAVVIAVVGIVVPATTVPTLIIAAVGCGLIPGLPCVQGAGTNLVGDLMSGGTNRGRLLLQVVVAGGMLAAQVAVAAVGLVLTGVAVNALLVQFLVPALRTAPAQCRDIFGQPRECAAAAANVSGGTTPAVVAGALGVLAVVAVNVVLAIVAKGPVLALAYKLHADAPIPAPYPRFLPTLAQEDGPPAAQAPVAQVAYQSR